MNNASEWMYKLEKVLYQLGFIIVLCLGLFMTFTGLLGFIGWFSDPSSNKWGALFVGVMSGLLTFGWWKLVRWQLRQ